MNSDALHKLTDFCETAARKSFFIGKAKGGEAERLANELSEYITEETQALVKLGVSVNEIQQNMRSAMERYEQEQARESETPESHLSIQENSSYSDITITVYFVPMQQSVIEDFASGFCGKKEFASGVCAAADVAAFENLEGVSLLLTGYGKIPNNVEITEGGEIVADSDGNAYLPESWEFSSPDGQTFSVCEPAVFKSPEEVKRYSAYLAGLDFDKLINPRKLKKSEFLSEYSRCSIKKELPYIIDELRSEFVKLQEVYRIASERDFGILTLTGSEGTEAL